MKKGKEWLKAEVNKILLVDMPDGINYYDYMNLKNSLNELINQLDEPEELPVIPQYVDEWITEHHEEFDLYPALRRLVEGSTRDYSVYEWYRANALDFVVAYLTGKYEVEEQYYALIKGHENIDLDDKYWNFCITDESLSIGDNKVHPDVSDDYLLKATQYQWENLGINETNADFIPVKGVE